MRLVEFVEPVHLGSVRRSIVVDRITSVAPSVIGPDPVTEINVIGGFFLVGESYENVLAKLAPEP